MAERAAPAEIASVFEEAKSVLLDQSTIHANARTFRVVMEWMNAAPTPAETEGMKRILQAKIPCQGD